MTRNEAINKAVELKIILIKLSMAGTNKPQDTSALTWWKFFSKYPMRTRTQYPELGLLGFIDLAEKRIAHYKNVLAEA